MSELMSVIQKQRTAYLVKVSMMMSTAYVIVIVIVKIICNAHKVNA